MDAAQDLSAVGPHRRQYLVHEQCRAFYHPSCAAARAKPSPLAAEGHQFLGMTVRTACAQKSILKATALQVILELAAHEHRQAAPLGIRYGNGC
jgi:hypothetical protein